MSKVNYQIMRSEMTEATIRISVKVDIDLDKIIDYIASKGWNYDGSYGHYGVLYTKGCHSIVIPITDKIADWNSCINSLLIDLAREEGIDIVRLLNNINKFNTGEVLNLH